MKNIVKTTLVFASVSMMHVLCAKTIAWYHFNECENGVKTTGGSSQILNAVDPASLAGKPYMIGLNSQQLSESGVYLPAYTNVFPSGATWRDPRSGKKGEDRRGLFLNSSWKNGGGHSGVVLVDDDEKLHCENITVELMLKFCGAQLGNWSHICMMRNGPGNTKAWGMHINTTGTLNIGMNSFSSPDEFGAVTTNTLNWSSGVGVHANLLDGKWHHVAFSYDGNYVRLYVDYALVPSGTLVWNHGISYSDILDGRLCIGGNDKATYGRWEGFVDEVRISDEVLMPEDFLRPAGFSEHGAIATDNDTALFMSFDSLQIVDDSFFGTTGLPMVYNESISADGLVVKVASTGGIFPENDKENIVSNVLNNGIFSEDLFANNGCWTFGTGENVNRSIHMYVDDYSKNNNEHLISSGDFTIEYWIKSTTAPASSIYLVCEQSGQKGAGTMLLYLTSGNQLICRLVSREELEDYEREADTITYNDASYNGICDGEWHHVALVVDRVNRFASFYVDHKLVKCHKDFELASVVAASANYKPLQISGGWGGGARSDQFYNMSIDELRITRRPLAPQEFLKAGAHGQEAIGSTRMHAGFEGTFDALPRPEETLLNPQTSGSVPSFSRRVPGNAILDGAGNILKIDNTNSVSFADNGKAGRIHYARNVLLERDMQEQTVEFFMRAPKGSFRPWSHLLHLGLGDAAAGLNVWSIGYCSSADNGISVRIDTDLGGMAAGEPGFNQVVYAKGTNPADGSWHHIAVTFALYDEVNTLVRIYKDYELVGEQVINGRLKMGNVPTSLNIGMAENANYFYEGLIDEVRISKGVLQLEQMMHADWVGRPFRIIVR